MNNIIHDWLISGMWIVFSVYWGMAARGNKTVRRRENIGSQVAHFAPLILAVYLTAVPRLWGGFLSGYFAPEPYRIPMFAVGTVIVVLGFGFAVWARVHLAGNWSGTVTLKTGHELIRSGPYRWVRHPIYTGLLAVLAGATIAFSQWRGVVGFAIAVPALWRKAHLEERWLGELFGGAYKRYRAEVAMLLPFIA